MASTRVGTRISSRVNKLAGRKVADRDSIQQVCDNTNTRKLMTWLDTILEGDVLTESEYLLWEEMEAALIDDLFSGEEHEEKLPALRVEKSTLESEIAALEQQLADSEAREALYTRQMGILSDDAQRSQELSAKMSSRLGTSQDSIKTVAAGKVLQHRYEKQLDALKQVVEDHVALHSTAAFLSSLTFDDYIASEVECTRALGRYTEKLFFPGISSIPGDPRDCSLIQPDTGKENTASQAYQKVKDTVKKVKSTYLASQRERISEALNLASCQAKVDTYKSLLSDLANGNLPSDEESLSRIAEEHSIRSVGKENDLKLIWENEARPLLDQLKNLQDVSILCGDYNLKLARQDYFMSRQDLVIENLIQQLSRQELLQILLEHEYKQHRQSVSQLEEINSHITVLQRSLLEQRELTEGEDPIRPVRPDKLCLAANDTTLNCAVQMLQDYLKSDSHNIFQTFEGLEEALRALVSETELARGTTTQHESQLSDALKTLENNVLSCAKCLERGFSSANSQEEKSAALECALGELELLAGSLKDQFRRKCEAVLSNENVSVARKLFVYFFTDSDKLTDIMNGNVSAAELTNS